MPDFKKNNNKINFLGFDLDFDNILILSIIFILYKEETKDIYIYIALFLLLAN